MLYVLSDTDLSESESRNMAKCTIYKKSKSYILTYTLILDKILYGKYCHYF